MGLTKAEKQHRAQAAALDAAAKLDAAKTASMHRTVAVLKDLLPPLSLGNLSRGWTYNDSVSWVGAGAVSKACSSPISHGDGWEKTSSQHPLTMYSTELLATKALRYALAEKFAEWLAKWDKRIAELEQQKG